MRSTRNAAKGTPPPAKKGGKGTPGKTTPKGEKKEDDVKAEKKEDNVHTETAPVAASEADDALPQPSASVDVKPEDESTQEKSEGAEMMDTVKDEEAKPKSPEKEVVQDSEKVYDKAMEDCKESAVEREKNVEETKDGAPADVETDTSKAVEDAGNTEEVSGGEELEMQEANTQDRVEAAGTDDAGNEEAEEDNEEEDDEGEEDYEEDEADDELVECRPVSERQKRKKLEVFVGGLDKEATVEEVKKVFEAVGDVEEVRLMTHPQTGKNRGYAFVRFATTEQAVKAASELDRTKIRGKECAVVPSEDNDTLFVGNICKSWTSEQVSEKLKEYGVEGIDEMVLAEDQEHEGHNRGHAFLEFVTHSDAIKAFKRLSRPDAIFGCDRSAKVAWAEGASEPDESVTGKVKSVFVSGMPEHWENDKIKEHFGKFGDVERIVLAKNISRSKRTDFAFVNFATRDAATAAIEAMNDAEVTDGEIKVKLKVELSKPTPRKKRMRGHRGSYPVGGRPSKQKKGEQRRGEGGRGDQKRGEGGRADQRRGEGGRARSHTGRGGRVSLPKNFRGTKRKAAEDRPLPEERSRDRHNRGPRNARAGAAVPRGNARGGSSRRGRTGAYSDEEYMPLGARISPGYVPSRGYTGRPPREAAYPLRAERGVAYSGLGAKRSYSAMDEEVAYYGSGARGYPRARVEYGEPARYSDSLRATSLGHGSLGHVLPRGGHGYTSVMPAAADYGAYGPAGATDPRGAAYPSTYYGSRGGSGYSLPSGSGPYY